MTTEATPDWMQWASCLGVTATMFPEHGASAAPAKKVCAGCDVSEECLAFALAHPMISHYGIWGGTTERQRRHLRRGDVPVLVRRTNHRVAMCGTMGGYQHHLRFDEPICEPCAEARRAYYRTPRARAANAKRRAALKLLAAS